jgi:hypothetical protein
MTPLCIADESGAPPHAGRRHDGGGVPEVARGDRWRRRIGSAEAVTRQRPATRERQPRDHGGEGAAMGFGRPEGHEHGGRPRAAGGRPPGGHARRAAEDAEVALRALVGSGHTKVPRSAAMRARDIAQPDDADLAEAERVIDARLAAARARPRPAPGGRRGQPGQAPLPAEPARPVGQAGRPGGPRRPSRPATQTAGGAGAPDGTAGSSPVRS